jgi:hypothetical protein
VTLDGLSSKHNGHSGASPLRKPHEAGNADNERLQADLYLARKVRGIYRSHRLQRRQHVGRASHIAAAGAIIPARPSVRDVAGTYFILGVKHIMMGIDHLLFESGQ